MTNDQFDLTIMQVAEPALGAQVGERILITHPRERCEGKSGPCCIHFPSNHHMRTWQMNWRADTRVMERLCPHGIGHPDPDHMTYARSLTPEHECIFNRDRSYSFTDWMDLDEQDSCPFPHLEWQGIHSCDGCCITEGKR
jgi:hypothetical protein